MTTSTLAASGGLTILIATVYVTVGLRLIERPVEGEARDAVFLFGTWWLALAGSMVLDAMGLFLAAGGILNLALATVLDYVGLFFISVALMGLVYYLVYLFTGWTEAMPWLVAFYLGFFVLAIYSVSQADPSGVTVGTWTLETTYEEPLGGPLLQVLLLLLLVPPMLGALGYATLLWRVENPTQRYRIGMVSASILLWFGSAYGAALVGLSNVSWWPLVSDGIGLLAALAIWAAYVPPGWIREQLGVSALGEQPGEGVRPAEAT